MGFASLYPSYALLRSLVFERPEHRGVRAALAQLDSAENPRRAREGLPQQRAEPAADEALQPVPLEYDIWIRPPRWP